MNKILTKEENQLMGANYMPAVSIMLPFDPKMSLKEDIDHRLRIILGKVSKQLMSEYPAEKALPVINKLTHLIHELNFNTHKKSMAIFVSPLMEKVFYLNIPIEEKIIIDESFEIRDLIFSKKQTTQYLILMLSAETCRMFLGYCSSFMLIKANLPDIHAYERDLPGKTTNFSDMHAQKEILLDSFMHHMDDGLTLVLKEYPLPVFVMGSDRVTGHFKKITKNEKSIVQYIHGNFREADETLLREIMKPYLDDWKKIKEQALLQEMEKAISSNKFVSGIQEVWSAATHKNGKLLIVEKDFNCPAYLAAHLDKIQPEDENERKPFYIKDAVDDVMEKVLESGGDVEFVDNGVLVAHDHIGLIKFF
jgi:hypothetical protein